MRIVGCIKRRILRCEGALGGSASTSMARAGVERSDTYHRASGSVIVFRRSHALHSAFIFRPSGADLRGETCTHGLRRGLHSFAASRLPLRRPRTVWPAGLYLLRQHDPRLRARARRPATAGRMPALRHGWRYSMAALLLGARGSFAGQGPFGFPRLLRQLWIAFWNRIRLRP
jgi:hypothetical protein